MTMESKLESFNKIDILRNAYVNQKLSTTEISKRSEELFGVRVSVATIYKELIRQNIPVRNKSESVSRAKSILNQDESFLTEELTQWIDGLTLGDGSINFRRHSRFAGARVRLESVENQWVIYGMSGLQIYLPSSLKNYQKIDDRHPNIIWVSQTKTHPDIVNQAKRWYAGENEQKQVPDDVRITPTSILLWYLGDGSFTYVKDGNISILRLHTCSFTPEIINGLLIPKLEALGLRCKHEKSKNDIRICADSIRQFFNIIGHKSPISCYDYKFDIPEWLKLLRLSHIVKDKQERYRAQYYFKMGQIECSKSPGGEMLLFTDAQAEALKKRLKNE